MKRKTFRSYLKYVWSYLLVFLISVVVCFNFTDTIYAANGDTYGVNTPKTQILRSDHGNYHGISYITVSNYNADGTVTVTLSDYAYSTNGAYNYWTGDGLIYVDNTHVDTMLTNGRIMTYYNNGGVNYGYQDTISVSFNLAQGKTYTIEQRNRVYGDATESSTSYTIYVYVPSQTYTATMVHYMRNATNTAWTSFQTTSQTVTRGATFTPSFVTAPTGYYTSSYNTWTAGYGTYLGSGSITMPASNTITELYYYPNNYYLDLNGYLNGMLQGNISSMGTADVYVNGTLVANDVSDYYEAHPYGSTYEIKDIKTNNGYTYTGDASYSGTITGATVIAPIWTTNTYTNTITHWAWGFQNGEGNNGTAKTAFNLGKTSFTKKFKESYTLSANDAIPNGYQLRSQFCTNSLSSDGTWHTYDLGYTDNQLAKNLEFEYEYDPITYTITYDTEGGTINDVSYSTTYNVIYGVSFPTDVTKEGYIFNGWKIENENITGINEECINSFDSIDTFYAEMEKRVTGNKIVQATWRKVSAPSITTTDQYFYQNEVVSTMDLLKKNSALDEIDGDLSGKVTIVSMSYPNGTLVHEPMYLNTEEIGKVLVNYECVNSAGIKSVKSAYAIIIKESGELVLDTRQRKVYSRFISYLYINTLSDGSIWETEEYKRILLAALMRENEDYLREYEWINN